MTLDSLEGDLQHIRLPKVLFILGAQEANGILTVQGEDDIVAVSFVQGAIVTADALNQTVEDGLGKVLSGKGWISQDQFNAATHEHQGGATGSLGDMLVGKGLINRKQLLEALRLQTLRSMLQLLTWKTGDFKFYSGDEVSFEEGFVPIGVDELILRGVSKLGEKAGLVGSIPDDRAVYRAVPPRGPIKIVGRDGDGLEAGIWLTAAQASFLDRINGATPTAEIGRAMGLSRQQLLFTLYRLTQFDLVEVSARAPARAPRPVAAPPSQQAPVPGDPSGMVPRPPMGEPSGTFARPDGSGLTPRGASGTVPQPPVEIFSPPEPEAVPPRVAAGRDKLLDWVGLGLAALLLFGAFATVVSRPMALLLPFPWQENPRSTVERQIRESLFRRIDRGARTYFLMEAHYPDALSELRDLSLISAVDLKDPAGRDLDYTTEVVSYQIDLRKGDQVIEGLGTTEAITGDFLVDPQFLSNAATAEDPVVLLD